MLYTGWGKMQKIAYLYNAEYKSRKNVWNNG